MKFFNAISRRLWGNVSGFELIKFLYLAAGSFCLIGAFWPLKPLKQSIFVNMVGSDYVPTVRMISVLFVFAIVLLYSKIVDHFSKQRLIYAFLAFFVSVGSFLVYCLMHPEYGLANTDVGPHRWVAWAFVLFTESYITVMQSLFWSFVNDIT